MYDQKAKSDAGKARLSLVPTQILFDIARVREYENRKYGKPDNWKTVEIHRYRDAMLRHIARYIDEPFGVDEESGLPHLWHATCNMAFLCELERKRAKDLERLADRLKNSDEQIFTLDAFEGNRTVTEWCSHCESEITMEWDVEKQGYKAYCPSCGRRLMLCSDCKERGYTCDYDGDLDFCRHNNPKTDAEKKGKDVPDIDDGKKIAEDCRTCAMERVPAYEHCLSCLKHGAFSFWQPKQEKDCDTCLYGAQEDHKSCRNCYADGEMTHWEPKEGDDGNK